jgi:hypothetical protein
VQRGNTYTGRQGRELRTLCASLSPQAHAPMSGQLATSRAATPRLGATPSALSRCWGRGSARAGSCQGSTASWSDGSKSPLFSVSRIAGVPESTTSEHYTLATSEMVGEGDSELADPKKLAAQPCPRPRHLAPSSSTSYNNPSFSASIMISGPAPTGCAHSRSGRTAYPTKSPAPRQQLAHERRRRVELTQNWVWFRGDYWA